MVKGKYKHYKGNLYEVINTAIHTETGEVMVIYKALYHCPGYSDDQLWTRPQVMFLETVEYKGHSMQRFELVGETQ